MKKILISLMVIAVAVGLVASASGAFFSDKETSTGNTFTAGTIDLAVDGNTQWTETYTFDDIKPCEVNWIEFVAENVGGNPAVVWKHIHVTSTETGTVTEPECTDQGGTWDNGTCTWGAAGDNNAIDTVMTYDLIVVEEDGTEHVIFEEGDHIKVSDVDCVWMPLGTIEPGESITVKQSYHLQGEETENWAQGDTMTLDIELYAEQRLGSGPEQQSSKLFLDNKTGEDDWYFIPDDTWGLLSKASSFDLHAQGLQADTDYSLIVYPEPQTTWPWPITVKATGTSDAYGVLDITGITLGALTNEKIWLVLSDDINASDELEGWNPDDYLFEANLFTNPFP